MFQVLCWSLFNLVLANFFVLYNIGTQFHSYICILSFHNTIYGRDCIFNIVYSWHLSQRSVDNIYVDFISGLSLLFHWSVCLFASTMLFWLFYLCHIFCNLEVKIPPSLFFSLRIALATQDLLWSIWIFRIVFPVSLKNDFGLLIGIVLNL